ncbi:signal-regulatory protein beta-2 isoform X2 [Anarrhichthys ocellatus]|uniref:signal-regulatory protein beta-2 isoform X2 n=1 Tax=Anarrhichthys ocellatus TaxID=433405 RepID=UPI0012EE40E5|nr:signal-regulatory protein beta-2 isoform X2 [Anarrhichthys ocellatus]
MMLHFVNVFLLWSLSAAQLSDISQPVAFQAVKLGDSATIECHIKSELKKRVWYRYTPGEGLQLVAAFNYFYNQTVFADESHFRYSVKFDRINSHLSISATTWEDAGTYFCGVLQFKDIQFGSGTFLMLKGANVMSESKSVQPGDSVSLSCSVQTGRCAAQHTSHHSAPQLMYSSGEKTVQSEGTTCLYSHLMRNRSSDDAGTYFCIVTSCGQTLLGNGTRINIHNNAVTKPAELSPAVIALMLSNIILGIVTLVLTWTLCKSRRKYSSEATDGSSEGHQKPPAHSSFSEIQWSHLF